ncbi:MAG TPA: hypothetical protein VHE79_06875, partial [Spirochaetia bacterium]
VSPDPVSFEIDRSGRPAEHGSKDCASQGRPAMHGGERCAPQGRPDQHGGRHRAPQGEGDDLPERILRAERSVLLAKLRRSGVPVVDWDTSSALGASLRRWAGMRES